MKANLLILATILLFLAAVLFKSLFFLFYLFLVVILLIAYYITKNGSSTKKSFFGSLMIGIRKRRIKQRTEARKKLIREKFIKPKPLRLFIPFFIFLIIIYVFLSHTVFFAVVTSDSMYPTFKTGDLLVVQSADIDDIEVGDIIMFTVPSEKELIVHRVESIGEDGIRTKGDATNATDNWIVDSNDVEAKLVTIGGSPVTLKEVGWYFIDNAPSSAPFSGELYFTSMMLMSFKSIGIALFMIATVLYLFLTARDIKRKPVHRRRH